MKMVARDYQTYASKSVLNYFWQNMPGVPLVLMPTGTGKSIVIADFIETLLATWSTLRVLVVTHVKELVQQNHDKLLAVWPNAPCGIFSSGLKQRETRKQIIFGGIASVVKSMTLLGAFDMIIIDEAHLIGPNDKTMYRKYIDYQMSINPHVKVWGLTATGFRLGFGKLTEDGGLFTHEVCNMTSMDAFNWFIEEGYLLPPVPRPTHTNLNVSGVHMRGGEYIMSELIAAVDHDEQTEAALKEACELGGNRKAWLIFATGKKHAATIQQMLCDMGVPCGLVLGEEKECSIVPGVPTARKNVIDAFKAGKLRAVVNNNVLTTGFDHPDIDMIIMLRPTASSTLWVQMLGRGTRPVYMIGFDLSNREGRWAAILASHKRDCLVLDFAGNTRKLGPINDPVVPRKKGKGGGEAPIKECPACGVLNHARAAICVGCYYKFEFSTKLKQGASTQEILKKSVVNKIEIYKVYTTTYTPHVKVDRPPMMKVIYHCGAKSFTDYVCVEHPDYAGRKALSWWRKRTGDGQLPVDPITGLPSSAEALKQFNRCKVPTHLSVWMNPPSKHPEITDYCFDGTAFNREQDNGERPSVMNNVVTAPAQPMSRDTPFSSAFVGIQPYTEPRPPAHWDINEDDIPF